VDYGMYDYITRTNINEEAILTNFLKRQNHKRTKKLQNDRVNE